MAVQAENERHNSFESDAPSVTKTLLLIVSTARVNVFKAKVEEAHLTRSAVVFYF